MRVKKTLQERLDGWASALTGIGLTGRDKRLGSMYTPDLLQRQELEDKWRGDDIVARIIETIPQEMMRPGFELKIQPEREADLTAEREESPDLSMTEETNAAAHEEQALAESARGQDVRVSPADPYDPRLAEPVGQAEHAKAENRKRRQRLDAGINKLRFAAAKAHARAQNLKGQKAAYEKRLAVSFEMQADYLEARAARMDAFESAIEDPGQTPPSGDTESTQPATPGKAPTPPILIVPPHKPGPINRGDDTVKDQIEGAMAKWEEIRGAERFLEAFQYERAYGGAGILIGADDGQVDLTQPLDLDKIRAVNWLNVLTPRELYPVSYYNDPQGPKYGEPEIYRIQPETVPASAANKPLPRTSLQFVEIHESRLIIFPGIIVSRLQRRINNGWGDAVLNRCNQVINDFQMTWAAAAILLQDFSQAVLKIKDLAELIETDDDDTIIARAQAIDMARSVARAVIIDAEEEYERKVTPMAGLPEMMDKFANRLASAAKMPVEILMGQSPGGLNSTADNQLRWFYDTVDAERNKKLRPALEKIFRAIFLSKEGPTKGVEPEVWSLEFNPPWQMTDVELADLRYKQAQTDEIYLGAQVVTPEEIAASRFGGDAWSHETILDFDARAAVGPDMTLGPDGKPLPPKPGAPGGLPPKGGKQNPLPKGEGQNAKAIQDPNAPDGEGDQPRLGNPDEKPAPEEARPSAAAGTPGEAVDKKESSFQEGAAPAADTKKKKRIAGPKPGNV